jgi:hypothetical protein
MTNKSELTDGILALANYFKEHGFNPPISIEVDKLGFKKILSESAKSHKIDIKKAVTEHEFSISDVTVIEEEQQIKR